MSHNFRRRPAASEAPPHLLGPHVPEIFGKLQKPYLAHRGAEISRRSNANEPFRCSQDFAARRGTWQRAQLRPGVVLEGDLIELGEDAVPGEPDGVVAGEHDLVAAAAVGVVDDGLGVAAGGEGAGRVEEVRPSFLRHNALRVLGLDA